MLLHLRACLSPCPNGIRPTSGCFRLRSNDIRPTNGCFRLRSNDTHPKSGCFRLCSNDTHPTNGRFRLRSNGIHPKNGCFRLRSNGIRPKNTCTLPGSCVRLPDFDDIRPLRGLRHCFFRIRFCSFRRPNRRGTYCCPCLSPPEKGYIPTSG